MNFSVTTCQADGKLKDESNTEDEFGKCCKAFAKLRG